MLPVGLDIGARGVRFVRLKRVRDALVVSAAGRLEFDAQTLELPPEERVGASVPALKRKLEEAGVAGAACVLSIDDALVRVRSIRQPKMPEAETDRAVRLEAAERLGFGPEESVEVDWLLAGDVRQGEAMREELIIFGAHTRSLERVVDSVADAGLRPTAIEPGFLALGRAFSRTYRRRSDHSSVRAVVDLGYRQTGVLVLRGAAVVFYKTFELGGAELDRVASEALEMDVETVAGLRRRRMRSDARKGNDEKVDNALFDAVRPALESLADEVGRCLRYYSVTFRGLRPERLILVGGEAREPGLDALFGAATNLEAHVGRPLEGLDASEAADSIDRRGDGHEWGVATGLSLRGDPAMLQAAEESPSASAEAGDEADSRREAA